MVDGMGHGARERRMGEIRPLQPRPVGVYNESQLDEGRGATYGQYHKFAYVDNGGISIYLMTKLIALLSQNPLLDIVTMASAAANMEDGTIDMASPRRIDRRHISYGHR